MITAVTGIIVVIAIFVIGLFFARRILRLALKLAFVGSVVFALFAGGIFGWWRGWFESSPRTQRPAAQTNQQRNSSRRPPANR
jgi:hypothetical protein